MVMITYSLPKTIDVETVDQLVVCNLSTLPLVYTLAQQTQPRIDNCDNETSFTD